VPGGGVRSLKRCAARSSFQWFLMDLNPEILDGNVQGLNDPVKRHDVREFIALLH
jgi:hypothetical protein